ncbi:uncharacterized protein [Antedon mediterranea]|uniref:uncharacterized protein n=1 Tax=Antedon mediterranea TaxID=105859 RepID=UPI003AF96B07
MNTYPLIQAVDEADWSVACSSNTKLQHYIDTLRPVIGDAYEKHKATLYAAASVDSINETFGKGETLLHWAASRNYFDSFDSSINEVFILLHLGADPNARDELGRTPLHWVVTYWKQMMLTDSNILENLLCFGASPNITDMYGSTPLCLARWVEADDLVKILEPLTDASLVNYIDCVHNIISSTRDIRRSKITNWIENVAGDRQANRERLCQLLCTRGTGIIQYDEEERQQNYQIFSFLNRVSDEISKNNPEFAFRPYLAGSSAEGTKQGMPDEKDIIVHLENFTDNIIPEQDADDQFIKLKVTTIEPGIYKEYISDGFLNRTTILKPFIRKFNRAMSITKLWNSDECTNIYPGECVSSLGGFEMIDRAANEGDICMFDVIWCGEHYKSVRVTIDIVPAIVLNDSVKQRVSKYDSSNINHTLLILKSKAETFDYTDDENELPIMKTNEEIVPAKNCSTFYMKSHVHDIEFSDSENESDIDYDLPSDGSLTKDDLRELDEESREEGRVCVRKEVDIGQTAFHISVCAMEVKVMKSLPETLRVAYVLSKALVKFIPEIRTVANKGIHPEFDYYEGRKDISSYMIKVALFEAHRKYQRQRESNEKSQNLDDHVKHPCSPQTKSFDAVDQQQHNNVSRPISSLCQPQCSMDTPSACRIFEVSDVSQLISQSSCSKLSLSKNRFTPSDISSKIEDIALWVERIFTELEEAACKENLPVFFNSRHNVLDKVITLSHQKGFPYPGLTYLRVHCKMIRALVQI